MDATTRDFLASVRAAVEPRLRAALTTLRHEVHAAAPAALPMVDTAADLTLRGGKRLRPALLQAAAMATAREIPLEPLGHLGAALELFQTYLLIHDDWMDGDPVRRGAPSVHTALGTQWRNAHLGACGAILAGDLLSGVVHHMVARVELAPAHRVAVMDAFAAMERDVIVGQCLDVLHHPDVRTIYALKTGSYTVRGPLRLGAASVGASASQFLALDAFADPLGEAFQLRDDVLGAYGDEQETGKPVGGDFREGKQTFLVRHALQELGPRDRDELLGQLGRPDVDVDRVRALMDRAGARDAAEARIAALRSQCGEALGRAEDLYTAGIERLQGLADAITERTR